MLCTNQIWTRDVVCCVSEDAILVKPDDLVNHHSYHNGEPSADAASGALVIAMNEKMPTRIIHSGPADNHFAGIITTKQSTNMC